MRSLELQRRIEGLISQRRWSSTIIRHCSSPDTRDWKFAMSKRMDFVSAFNEEIAESIPSILRPTAVIS
ncbi:hypothetical protein NDU88_003214 [Pleurodeles waltl]|uniref:Uncharacterized protein n=1 Tax=Pleurodeles waltl TaxID=8319 RepID=A0AAV7WS72_PLEWA|nr:hypothetical protein NDU88_003214 [Pleurodeles waltl]